MDGRRPSFGTIPALFFIIFFFQNLSPLFDSYFSQDSSQNLFNSLRFYQDLADLKIVPQWKPFLQSEMDTSYFDTEYTQLPARDTPLSRSQTLPDSVDEKFIGFSFDGDQ
jgi:hypothetical protein